MEYWPILSLIQSTRPSSILLLSINIITQGRSQDLGEGGAKNFFCRFGNLHVAKRHVAIRFAKGVRGNALFRENFLKWCNLVRFGVYFDPILSLQFFQKYHFFYKKIIILDTRLLLSITHRETFENMLRLMCFGVYFERVLKIKWLFSYRNNYSIITRIYALGARGHKGKNYENMVQLGAFWCLFDQMVS